MVIAGRLSQEKLSTFTLFLLFNLFATVAQSQDLIKSRFEYAERPVRANGKTSPALLAFKLAPQNARPGEVVTSSVTMELDAGWSVSATSPKNDVGEPTVINVKSLKGLKPLDEIYYPEEPAIVEVIDDDLDLKHHIHRREVTWTRRFQVQENIKPGEYGVTGDIAYQVCKNACLPPQTIAFHLGETSGARPLQDPPISKPSVPELPPRRLDLARVRELVDLVVGASRFGYSSALTPNAFILFVISFAYGLRPRSRQGFQLLWDSLVVYGAIVITAVGLSLLAQHYEITQATLINHDGWMTAAFAASFALLAIWLLKFPQLQLSRPFGELACSVAFAIIACVSLHPLLTSFFAIFSVATTSAGDVTSRCLGLAAFGLGAGLHFASAEAVGGYVAKMLSHRSTLRTTQIAFALSLLVFSADYTRWLIPALRPTQPLIAISDSSPEPQVTHRGVSYCLDFDQGLAFANKWNKPLLVEFAGVVDLNSRLSELRMSRPELRSRLDKFVRVQLYVDMVPRVSKVESLRLVKRNQKLQEQWLGTIVTASYVVVAPDGKTILLTQEGLGMGENWCGEFLDEGWRRWELFQKTGLKPD